MLGQECFSASEKDEKTLKDALIVKVKLGELGIEVPIQLQEQIDNLRAKYAKKAREVMPEKTLTKEQKEKLLSILKVRFEANPNRHRGVEWVRVETRLNEVVSEKLWALSEMERTGGEPDVIGCVKKTGEFEFFDCSAESPKGRRNVCYDREGQRKAERQGFCPSGNAEDMAADMSLGGILDEDQIRNSLQKLGNFDSSTWSWVKTSPDKRMSGVALLAYRSDENISVRVADPSARGSSGAFRGWIKI
jgi:hypothetical protein